MTTFYKNDITRLTNAELRRVAPTWPAYVILRLRKFLHWPFAPKFGIQRSQRLDTLEFDELPRTARRTLRETIDECEDLGFALTLCYTVECLGPVETYAAALLSPDGLIWASGVWTRVRIGSTARVKSGCAFISLLDESNVISTTNLRQEYDVPPGVEPQYCPGALVAKLLKMHEDRLRTHRPRKLPAAELKDAILAMIQRAADWHIGRGVWVPMTEAEVAQLRQRRLLDED